MLATALGAGGISLRSEQMRSLLWSRADGLGVLFRQFILEVLVMAVVAALVMVIVLAVRRLIGAINSRWVWKDPLSGLTPPEDGSRRQVLRWTSPQMIHA